MSSCFCKNCKKNTVIRDDITDNLVCETCGLVQSIGDNLVQSFGGLSDFDGTSVRVGDDYTYKENKIYNAKNDIKEITDRFQFSSRKTIEVEQMIDEITEGEFGAGRWFSILVGACSYVVRRRDNLPLSMREVASVIACDYHELGRMVLRVVDFLDLKLPEFDIVAFFEFSLKHSHSFAQVSEERKDEMVKQGTFLVQCLVKWFVTTGRQPNPIVAAIMVFVAELNQVKVQIEDIAKEVHAGVNTSKRRHGELLQILVKVGQPLPWGKNLTVKNVVNNAPSILRYMELKSRVKPSEKSKNINNFRSEFEEIICGCLSKEMEFTEDGSYIGDDLQYYNVEDRSVTLSESVTDLDKLKISQDCLSKIYTKFSNDGTSPEAMAEKEEEHPRKRRKELGLQSAQDWWRGNSELSEKLSLREVLEKNVGYNNLPPSFVANKIACQRRREKINAARFRIGETMGKPASSELKNGKEMPYGAKGGNMDWEDCIIEILLLHRVKEEEIEKGHYSTLLDLHVFDSVNASKMFANAKRQRTEDLVANLINGGG
ncbi:hypothetical protein C5167_011362 [Papaver somniferum]|uniref:BRF2-like C-terminal domain-containing protein n=1 Tax=Papaver somniferum TaxID=3469 RepID=A0A4Y7K2U2_PAPSO|nr:plant-specific TFIIB-related protein PTF2-like isoform X1 [Papaver somniferum]XP_026395191.1 plant-specific TFIIB-related protein PTF2-like isoform X1 [Papaver somniferum]XP_026395192.1 plant-specific TFIIB-related protein PTF2-like isoform X1 [Papaver somniferum]XP_026395193.1 plant-specific TFIIB-related protein PTF2-like isoform X1 [Papaver somniferum]XP_026395194.1 plant-specific TFIIB-related protein PTF2-like isoform X1 [Papaver somniferum]RZC67683.1 hypothetical protein C5167_011362 